MVVDSNRYLTLSSVEMRIEFFPEMHSQSEHDWWVLIMCWYRGKYSSISMANKIWRHQNDEGKYAFFFIMIIIHTWGRNVQTESPWWNWKKFGEFIAHLSLGYFNICSLVLKAIFPSHIFVISLLLFWEVDLASINMILNPVSKNHLAILKALLVECLITPEK